MRRRFCYNHFIKQRKNAESGADMEQNAIKTVAFGGFDKEDVARCIEKLSQETDAVRSERDALQEQADRLTQEEAAIYRRGRNAHSVTKAKNATVADYRAATGFEALMGYLYLKGDIRRVIELVREGLAAQKEQRNLQHKETRREEQEEQGK